MTPEPQPGVPDVLTQDEEDALSVVREAVEAARSECLSAVLDHVTAHLKALGVTSESAGGSPAVFIRREARFTVDAVGGPHGTFVVRFIPVGP